MIVFHLIYSFIYLSIYFIIILKTVFTILTACEMLGFLLYLDIVLASSLCLCIHSLFAEGIWVSK